jgi:predicted Abi (CAAX) family protease
MRTLIGAAASLLVFVLAHPINGMTLSRRAYPLFTDLAFLFQATLLGLVCSAAYLISGSIWLSVLTHWLPVTVWILFFGGARRVMRSKWWVAEA